MHRIRGGLLLLIALILLASPSAALAQNYSFEVPVQNVSVFVNSDGTLSLDYVITFANEPNADPIDIVDVGMPNYDYELYSISATIETANPRTPSRRTMSGGIIEIPIITARAMPPKKAWRCT